MFGKDMEFFAYQPLHGYRDGHDAVELPWKLWEQEAQGRGLGLADLFAEAPAVQRSEPDCLPAPPRGRPGLPPPHSSRGD